MAYHTGRLCPISSPHNRMKRMSDQSAEQSVARIFSPVLTVAAFSVLLAGCGPAASAPDGDDAMMPASSSSSVEAMMESSAMSSDAMIQSSEMTKEGAMNLYRDGTYSAEGMYRSPAGSEGVQVSLVLKGDVITDATYTGEATHPKSVKFQQDFGAGFKEQVVGKSIDQVSLGVINGSSLTGIGFMDAVSKIKAEAKA